MNKKLVGFLVVGLIGLAGCATTRSGANPALETRVQSLENRMQVVEADLQSAPPRSQGSEAAFSPKEGGAVDAQQMSKEDIQKALKNAGYYNGAIDGKLGPKTRAAITAFQKDMGLKVDGIPGRQTKEKLAKYL